MVINEAEAKTVRQIFSLYLELENVRLVNEECNRLSLRTKVRINRDKTTGGIKFSRGHLYSLLKNPLYAGKVKYKDAIYEGQHDPIIDPTLWQDVQNKLAAQATDRKRDYNQKQINLLGGMVFDEDNNLLKPNYTIKGGKKYRYYVATARGGWRIPAHKLECAIEKIICDWLKNEQTLYAEFASLIIDRPDLYQSIKLTATEIVEEFKQMSLKKKEETFGRLIERVKINHERIALTFTNKVLFKLLNISTSDLQLESISIKSHHTIKRRGIEKKIILPGKSKANKDQNLMRLIARSHQWLQNLKNGQVKSIAEIAANENMDDGDVSRFIQLAFLAPEIVTSIFKGTQPADLTSQKLKRLGPLPHCWSEQKARLGF